MEERERRREQGKGREGIEEGIDQRRVGRRRTEEGKKRSGWLRNIGKEYK